ncbi:pentapeptide repeat-containing protein, partial [Klebsiella pneumoniae]|uniref:pentapeptide repeat-containing protein n=1 Tax=Klebsiella pneumoniae TaxID=573 RepID=UPI0035C7B1DA
MTFSGIDLTDKKFYGCNFQHCFFIGIKAKNLRSRVCSFDFALFTDCNLLNSNIQYASFAGAKFIHVLFT